MKRGSDVAAERITTAIVVLRGRRVLLDVELAALYGVTTKRLNEQVRRNLERFPADFMFQLTAMEAGALRSQFATLKTGRGQHRKYAPYAFTENGAIMAATVLNSPRAVEMSIYVVRAFVQLRELLASNAELVRRLDELEARIEKKLTGHDQAIAAMLSAIRQLMPQRYTVRVSLWSGRHVGVPAFAQRDETLCLVAWEPPRSPAGGQASGHRVHRGSRSRRIAAGRVARFISPSAGHQPA